MKYSSDLRRKHWRSAGCLTTIVTAASAVAGISQAVVPGNARVGGASVPSAPCTATHQLRSRCFQKDREPRSVRGSHLKHLLFSLLCLLVRLWLPSIPPLTRAAGSRVSRTHLALAIDREIACIHQGKRATPTDVGSTRDFGQIVCLATRSLRRRVRRRICQSESEPA